jgi:RNA polymerase sigma factor (TIGR02999 family)
MHPQVLKNPAPKNLGAGFCMRTMRFLIPCLGLKPAMTEHLLDTATLTVRAKQGDADALHALFTAHYRDLKRIAHAKRKQLGVGLTLSTTALVHELYCKLDPSLTDSLLDADHFLSISARAMREVAIDYLRAKQAVKRSAEVIALQTETTLDQRHSGPNVSVAQEMHLDVVLMLNKLEQHNTRMATLMSLRYFSGATDLELAELFDIHERTVRHELAKAKAWVLSWMQTAA